VIARFFGNTQSCAPQAFALTPRWRFGDALTTDQLRFEEGTASSNSVPRELNVSIENLVEEIESATNRDLERIRHRIEEEFLAAKTSDERAQVLAIFKAMTDRVERVLAARDGEDELLANFRAANAYEYKSLLYQECLVAAGSPEGGDISVEKLMAVTDREIAAGRMTEDHTLRKIAKQCAAAPHLSHTELVAKHLKLQAEAASAAKTPLGNATAAYAFGTVLGRKIKGLLRK